MRMDKKDQKFEQIVSTAKSLFWRHGIKRVTVGEICEHAPVSKMTFYKHFSNKMELAKYILQRLFDEGIQQYREIEDSHMPYVEKVKRIMEMKMEFSKGISREFLNDLYKSDDPELKELVDGYIRRNLEIIQNDLIRDQQEGNIRKDIRPEFLVYMMNKIIDMSTDDALNRMYDSTQEMIQEFVHFFYYGVMPHK